MEYREYRYLCQIKRVVYGFKQINTQAGQTNMQAMVFIALRSDGVDCIILK
jgi:hypothetical protein